MSWQIAAIISTLVNHLSHCGPSLIKKYSCPPNLDTLEMDKCHLCLGTTFLILLFFDHSNAMYYGFSPGCQLSSKIYTFYKKERFAQIFQLPCSKLEACVTEMFVMSLQRHQAKRDMFYRYYFAVYNLPNWSYSTIFINNQNSYPQTYEYD